jgi:hypothetical protein
MQLAKILNSVLTIIVSIALISAGFWVHRWLEENRILRQVIERLSADSRVAEVLVTKSEYKEATKAIETTVKFLEYGTQGGTLNPKYFTFQGNIIQFQALVIRFQDRLVQAGDRVRGKSAYVFLKAFVLDGAKTQEFIITETNTVPAGYRISEAAPSALEKAIWEEFWDYALQPEARDRAGIKNAQIEAPGTMFLPGTIYTLSIEHDGGLRIDGRPVPEILKGEAL